MEAAGKNEGGAMSGFMGVGMGMNANGNYFAQASQTNQQQMQEKQNQQNAQGLQTLGLAHNVGLKTLEVLFKLWYTQNQQTRNQN